jgi:hypothetical protein
MVYYSLFDILKEALCVNLCTVLDWNFANSKINDNTFNSKVLFQER